VHLPGSGMVQIYTHPVMLVAFVHFHFYNSLENIKAVGMLKKRKCVVSESLLKEFEFLKRGVNEHSAFCSLCQTSFTLASGGRTSVSEHLCKVE
jgi:hypothetical protein